MKHAHTHTHTSHLSGVDFGASKKSAKPGQAPIRCHLTKFLQAKLKKNHICKFLFLFEN